MIMISWETMLLRLLLAAALGAVIGVERERTNWSAGMRTHMMVCVGSALVFLVSSYGFFEVIEHPSISLDPARLAAQVVSGIGFLGAGTIIFLRPGIIRGLTTASGLWTVAAIGLAVGAGLYFAAITTTLIAFSILLILEPLEKRFSFYMKKKSVKISIEKEANPTIIISRLINHEGLKISNFSFVKTRTDITIEIKFEKFQLEKVIPVLLELEKESEVRKIVWSK